MEVWIIFVIIVLLAGVLPALLRKRAPSYTYRAAPGLLTKGERAFADALEPCLPAGMRLAAKVRVADIITPANPRQIAAFRRISQKHIDFVLLDRAWQVLAAIELNDKSHERPDRQARDAVLRDAFQSAGVALHFVKAQARYSTAELSALVGGHVQATEPVHIPVASV